MSFGLQELGGLFTHSALQKNVGSLRAATHPAVLLEILGPLGQLKGRTVESLDQYDLFAIAPFFLHMRLQILAFRALSLLIQ